MEKKRTYKKRDSSQHRYRNHNKAWTKDEEEYLRESYGIRSVKNMSIYLGRSEIAVKQKMKKLNLYKSFNIYEAQANYSLEEIGQVFGKNKSNILRNWVKVHKMPVIEIRGKNNKVLHTIVEIDEMWKWLKENKDKLNVDMRQVDLNIVDFYPDWFLDDVKNLNHYTGKNRTWSAEDDKILERMYYKEGKDADEIAKVLKRTKNSILIRISKKTRKKLTKVA